MTIRNSSKIKTIKMLEDGNCLFRSITTSLESELMECLRYKNGKCKTHSLASKENSLSSSLREFTTIRMENDKEHYNDSISYDDNFFSSIENRIEKMKHPGEFAGNLELKIISKMLKIKINVFIPIYSKRTDLLSKYNLIACYGHDEYNKTINLVLEAEHYNVLVLE